MNVRPTFRPIAAPLDVDDSALERISDSLGVPALVKSESGPLAKPPQTPQNSANEVTRPSPGPKPKDSPVAKKPALPLPGPVEKLSIELPGYLTDAMKRQCVEARTSLRHIVMLGLVELGYHIEPGDLVPDGRRRPRTGKRR